MDNNIVLITSKELEQAIDLKAFINQAADNAHIALDKLIVMNAHISMYKRNPDIDNIEAIQQMRDATYQLISDIRGIHNTILKKMEVEE